MIDRTVWLKTTPSLYRRGEAQHPAPTTTLSSISRSLTSTDWLYIYNQQMLWPKTSQTIEKCASKRHRCRTGQSHKKTTIKQKFNNHSIHINVTSISLIMQPKKNRISFKMIHLRYNCISFQLDSIRCVIFGKRRQLEQLKVLHETNSHCVRHCINKSNDWISKINIQNVKKETIGWLVMWGKVGKTLNPKEVKTPKSNNHAQVKQP